jgi:hypothetical protein
LGGFAKVVIVNGFVVVGVAKANEDGAVIAEAGVSPW